MMKKIISVFAMTLSLSACSFLSQQAFINQAKRNPAVACIHYLPDPQTLIPGVETKIQQDMCGSRSGCESIHVASLSPNLSLANTDNDGLTLQCPVIAHLTNGHAIHGTISVSASTFFEYGGVQTTDLWTSNEDDIKKYEPEKQKKRDLRNGRCTKLAAAFIFAAQFRDSGMSPQQAYRQMQMRQFKNGLPNDLLKDIINSVFFDPDASSESPDQIYSTVINQCLFQPKVYQPLQ
jgi:PBP1b-binding outer membrane lipoprotein LpoB